MKSTTSYVIRMDHNDDQTYVQYLSPDRLNNPIKIKADTFLIGWPTIEETRNTWNYYYNKLPRDIKDGMKNYNISIVNIKVQETTTEQITI